MGPTTDPATTRPQTSRSVDLRSVPLVSAQQVISVSQKIVEANKQIGMYPAFLTIGAPQPEIFHQGGHLRSYQVLITEGMVKGCKSEAELAAVLCLELGRIVSEREASAPLGTRTGEPWVPPAEQTGHDHGSPYGGPDGTRLMEAARYAGKRDNKKPLPPPAPEALAKQYLVKAGYPESALVDVAPLLREAENNETFALQMTKQAPPPPPPPSSPGGPH
jgi:hypothetical protein